MKKLMLVGFVAATLFAFSLAQAGTHVTIKNADDYHNNPAYKARYDHPLTHVIANKNVKVDVTTDTIMHSCCMPASLVVAGKIQNVTTQRIDYVRLIFAFEDKDGRVLHTESMYNYKAVSLNDDAETREILKETPHFTPLAPGDTDTFSMQIPGISLPRYEKVELMTFDQRP